MCVRAVGGWSVIKRSAHAQSDCEFGTESVYWRGVVDDAGVARTPGRCFKPDSVRLTGSRCANHCQRFYKFTPSRESFAKPRFIAAALADASFIWK